VNKIIVVITRRIIISSDFSQCTLFVLPQLSVVGGMISSVVLDLLSSSKDPRTAFFEKRKKLSGATFSEMRGWEGLQTSHGRWSSLATDEQWWRCALGAVYCISV
jgi:hypothetical protein